MAVFYLSFKTNTPGNRFPALESNQKNSVVFLPNEKNPTSKGIRRRVQLASNVKKKTVAESSKKATQRTKAKSSKTGKGATGEATAEREATAEDATEPQSGIGVGKVEMIALKDIDTDDITYMFRAILRVGDLKKSLDTEGQQIPIVVRRGQGKNKYQIISGFRRTAAAKALKWPKIAAIVRTGLTDEAAFRAAVLENTARKTYSDIDRALIIKAYKDRGYGGEEVGEVMGLTKRQANNLRSLLELPKTIQEAIDDPEQHFGTTHALTLKQMASKYSKLDMEPCVEMVNKEELSVSQLKRRVNMEHGGEVDTGFTGLFQAKGTDWRKGEVRFAPVKVKFSDLSDADSYGGSWSGC